MTKKSTEWIEREVDSLVREGLISEQAQDRIRARYGKRNRHMLSVIPVALIPLIIGLALAVMGIFWAAAHVWYDVSMTTRLVVAVLILTASQVGMILALIQSQQAKPAGEIAALVQYISVFASVAIVEQTFYTGWDGDFYLLTCAVLGLPAVYLLRSLAGAIWYVLCLVIWAFSGGMLNASLGVGSVWILLILMLPLYGVFFRHGDEVRLSLYSWIMTITVYAVFAAVMVESDYIPFFVLGTLAVVMMLTGYSIDIRRAYGIPFRWVGRMAALGALVISTLPESWVGIASVEGFHWSTIIVTALLFFGVIALLAVGVKKRFWGPVLYAAIPVILGAETFLVRSEIYSSLPLILSFIYTIFLSFYEIVQGLKAEYINHLRLGIVTLIVLMVAVVFGNAFSPLVPLAVIVIVALIVTQVRRNHKKNGNRIVGSGGSRTVSSVRRENRRRNRKEMKGEDATLTASGRDTSTVPEWMQEKSDVTTVVRRPQEKTQFVAPVFKAPEDMPAPTYMTENPIKAQTEKVTRKMTSPWADGAEEKHKEKKNSVSPWSHKGGQS